MLCGVFGRCQVLFIVDLLMRYLVYDALSRCSFAVVHAVVHVFVVSVKWCRVMVLVGSCGRACRYITETFCIARAEGRTGGNGRCDGVGASKPYWVGVTHTSRRLSCAGDYTVALTYCCSG